MSGIPAGAGSLLGKRLGKYEILALLALGGTAEIYLARIAGAAGFEKYVVVKCLHDHLADDQTFVKMFLDEARLAAALDHSNIVQTMELGEYENRYFMVLEFLAGLSLAMIVRRSGERLQGGRVPPQLVLNMVAQACAGLHYAHERTQGGKPLNIVHRDISPQNLVVSFEGVVKVVDFGIAKAEHRETKTQSGTIKGKFAYMSPEQCVATNVDRRTDVFALGVIAWELLTGRRLFKKPSPYETYQAVIDCVVPVPSSENVEIDPALDPIIMKAVAKAKEDRYPTAEAFGDALLGYLHHRGKGSGPNDVSRWFDEFFTQEIEEHGARMRELISGRDIAIDAGVNWDEEDAKDKARADAAAAELGQNTVDIKSGDKALPVDTGDLVMEHSSSSSIDHLIDDLGDRRDSQDDMPSESTRIEANPLEKLRELEGISVPRTPTGKTPKPEPAKMPPSGPLPLPPAPPSRTTPAGGARVAADKVTSEKFPNLSNLPTMIAEPDPETPPPPASPELAPTAMAQEILDPKRRSTQMEIPAQAPPIDLPPRPQGPTLPPPQMHEPAPRPSMPAMPMPPPRPSMSNLPLSYPVMDKQMRGEIATGASVFPSVAQRAADLASPVGGQFGGDVDWAQAAASPARAIPKWALVLIFIGAIGIALAITIIIAKLAR